MDAGGRFLDFNAFTKLMGCCAFWLFFSVMLALTGRLRFTLALQGCLPLSGHTPAKVIFSLY
jgi:hypothetical protein